jgi:hypothetical protein
MSGNNGHNINGNGHAKRGPKPKIGDKEKAEIIAIVKVGGSLNDAADIIGIARDTLNRALRDDPKLRKGVDRAAATGKLRLVRKVGANKQPWQAAAWMLERKWGREYGKADIVAHEGTVKVEVEYVAAPANRMTEHVNGN